jgi:hypothetical protein|nr:MAG TPA: hypothetical protein [Caudoviricetes sp.]
MTDLPRKVKQRNIANAISRKIPNYKDMTNYNERKWWEVEEQIQNFIIAFIREHQKVPNYTQIAHGTGITIRIVSKHLAQDKRVDDMYVRRLKLLARTFSEKALIAMFNAGLKGNFTAAREIIRIGLGSASEELGLSSDATQANTAINISMAQIDSLDDSIAKLERLKNRDQQLRIVKGETVDDKSS